MAVSVPPQVLLALGVEAITTPLGKLSVREPVTVATLALEFVKLMVSTETLPETMLDGLNDLVSVGGTVTAPLTVNIAEAATALVPRLVCSAPTGRVLTYVPGAATVTVIVSVCVLLAASEPPVTVKVDPPTVAKIMPQVVLPVPAMTMPLGKKSVNGSVRLADVLFGLVAVMVSVEIPPGLIVAGVNVLVRMIGRFAGVLTVSVATVEPALLPLLVCNAPAASELK